MRKGIKKHLKRLQEEEGLQLYIPDDEEDEEEDEEEEGEGGREGYKHFFIGGGGVGSPLPYPAFQQQMSNVENPVRPPSLPPSLLTFTNPSFPPSPPRPPSVPPPAGHRPLPHAAGGGLGDRQGRLAYQGDHAGVGVSNVSKGGREGGREGCVCAR